MASSTPSLADSSGKAAADPDSTLANTAASRWYANPAAHTDTSADARADPDTAAYSNTDSDTATNTDSNAKTDPDTSSNPDRSCSSSSQTYSDA